MFLEPFQIVESPFLVLEVIVEHTVISVPFLEKEIAVEAFAHFVEFLSLGKNFGLTVVVFPFFARHLHLVDEQIGERHLHGAHLIAVAAKKKAIGIISDFFSTAAGLKVMVIAAISAVLQMIDPIALP